MKKLIILIAILFAIIACNKRKNYTCICTDDTGFEWKRSAVSGETYEEAYLQCVPSGVSDECILE